MNASKQGRPTPYNTGKVLIGSRYEPPRQYQMSRDAERLQSVLLGHRRRRLHFFDVLGYCILAVAAMIGLAIVL